MLPSCTHTLSHRVTRSALPVRVRLTNVLLVGSLSRMAVWRAEGYIQLAPEKKSRALSVRTSFS